MMIHDITAKVGADAKRWRVGRGPGSGSGKTSGRGHKGAGARAGWRGRTLQEGGALPLFRRVPIRGFSNANFTVRYQVVNVGQLDALFADGAQVTGETLAQAGLADAGKGPVKLLGDGEVSRKLTVTIDAISASAARKITEAGGTVTDLSGRLEARAKAAAQAQARAEAEAKAKAEAEAAAQAKAEAKAKAKAEAKAKKAEGKGEPKGEGKPAGKGEGRPGGKGEGKPGGKGEGKPGGKGEGKKQGKPREAGPPAEAAGAGDGPAPVTEERPASPPGPAEDQAKPAEGAAPPAAKPEQG